MATTPIFHGSQQETVDLLGAIARNCGCRYGVMGVKTSTCAPHSMMVSDQRALDGLVFERRRLASKFPGAGLRRIQPGG